MLAAIDWSAVGATAEWVGALALVLSGIFVARQAYELVRQSRAANDRAAFEAGQAATRDIDAVLAVLVERPTLRPYFFDNVELPNDVECKARILTLGVWMLDALTGGVHAGEFDHGNAANPMSLYAEEMLKTSPVMRSLLEEHPQWWGRLQHTGVPVPSDAADQLPAASATQSASEPTALRPSAVAAEIGAVRALVFFPLVVVPVAICRGLLSLARHGFVQAGRAVRQRDRQAKPPQPMSLALGIVIFLMALAISAISGDARGLRDRTTAIGFLALTVATFLVTPDLLGVDVLGRLDEWWEKTELPRYQLAFAVHARALSRRLVRASIAVALLVIFATFVLAGIHRAGGEVGGATTGSALGLTFASAVTVLLVAGSVRIMLGTPADAPAEFVTVRVAARRLSSPEARLRRRQLAAPLFMLGVLLTFVATVFMHS